MVIKQQKRFKYGLFTPEERDYWKNLHINIDAFCDKWEDVYSKEIDKYLKILSESETKDVFKHYKIKRSITKSYLQYLLDNAHAAIDFLCVVKFSLTDPKALSQLFDIPIVNGEVNKAAVIINILNAHKQKSLLEVFLMLQRKKFGKGNYKYDFNTSISNSDFQKYDDAVVLLCRYLKRYDKQNRTYHYRASFKGKDEWVFLLLKETADIIFPAIPENTRVLKGTYLLITIKLAEGTLEVNTKSKVEAYQIRDYLSRKIDNELRYIKKSSTYNPTSFFDEIKKEKDTKNELILTDVDFRDSNINSELKISDKHHKNDIFTQLNTLKAKDIIKLNDFSEFKSLSFQYQGISFRINVEENQWGQFRLNLIDRGKPKPEAQSFKDNFEKKFKIPLDTYLQSADASFDLKRLTRKLLERSTVEANLPKEVEDVLLDLINLKIITKPTKTSKRRCENPKCNKVTWIKGDCPSCGNTLLIEGNYIDLKTYEKGIYDFVYNLVYSTKRFLVKKTKKQIDGSSYPLIDLLDSKGNSVSIFISDSNVPEKITRHFQETGSSLIVVLTKFKDALSRDIAALGFECIDIAGLYAVKDDIVKLKEGFVQLMEKQKHIWQKKVIEKGHRSYQSLISKKGGYTDQDFEKDIYNVLHEIFLIGDRLGGKFAGIPAPDGIVSIQNYSIPLKRYCFAWDCKYSLTKKGYQLADPPEKHRKYINTLKKNSKVVLYGNLQTYAIISQNMDMKKYATFYSKLVKGFRWSGNILFVQEEQLLKLYKLYKDNEEVIRNSPGVFYSQVHKLFKVIPKKNSTPYKVISTERLRIFAEVLENSFKTKRINFTFERNEFH